MRNPALGLPISISCLFEMLNSAATGSAKVLWGSTLDQLKQNFLPPDHQQKISTTTATKVIPSGSGEARAERMGHSKHQGLEENTRDDAGDCGHMVETSEAPKNRLHAVTTPHGRQTLSLHTSEGI